MPNCKWLVFRIAADFWGQQTISIPSILKDMVICRRLNWKQLKDLLYTKVFFARSYFISDYTWDKKLPLYLQYQQLLPSSKGYLVRLAIKQYTSNINLLESNVFKFHKLVRRLLSLAFEDVRIVYVSQQPSVNKNSFVINFWCLYNRVINPCRG